MDVEAIVRDVGPQVAEQLKKQVTERVASAIGYSLQNAVNEATEKYIKEFVLPDVEKRLREDHEMIVSAICEAVGTSAMLLREKLIERTAKTLADSWKLDKVTKELFGVGF